MPEPTPFDRQAVAALAPGAVLRAALNLGNPNLVTQSPTEEYSSLSVDLATELGCTLSLPLAFVPFRGAGSVVEAANSDVWDIAFLTIDPLRADSMLFTSPYVTLPGSYVVRTSSNLTEQQEVDQEGVRIVVGAGSTYDLYLGKAIKRAALVQVSASSDVLPSMVREGYEVAAGVRQQLQQGVKSFENLRILDGQLMIIPQAMAVPKSHRLAPPLVQMLVETMKASGFSSVACADIRSPESKWPIQHRTIDAENVTYPQSRRAVNAQTERIVESQGVRHG